MTLSIKNKNILKLAIILSVFFGFFLGFNNGAVYAVSPCEQTYSSGYVSGNSNVFNNCSISSDYKYMIIENSSANTALYRLKIGPSVANYTSYIIGSGQTIFSVDLNNNSKILWFDNYTFSSEIKFSLVDSLPSGITPSGNLLIEENGSFNVANYETVLVSVPQTITEVVEDPISNDFQKVFFKIVENIIPAFGILLVVWFGIDMLSSLIFGRGR